MSKGTDFLIIGHRGAKACEAENTLGSFRRAIRAGADMLEFDVHQCKSGELIVIHDATLTRTTDKRGRISQMTLSQIKKARCANHETVPTLNEVMKLVGKRIRVNVEIKTSACVKGIIDFYQNQDLVNIVFSSFRWNALRRIRASLPNAQIGLLVEPGAMQRSPFKAALELRCVSINPAMELVNSAFIRKATKSGLKILVYGLRSDSDLELCLKLGVNGVFADDPARAIQIRQAFWR